MPQEPTRLPFEIDATVDPSLVTGRAGIPLVIELFRQLGVAQVLDAQVQVKQRQRGLQPSQLVETLIALWTSGGDRCQDLSMLREDQGLARLLGEEHVGPPQSVTLPVSWADAPAGSVAGIGRGFNDAGTDRTRRSHHLGGEPPEEGVRDPACARSHTVSRQATNRPLGPSPGADRAVVRRSRVMVWPPGAPVAAIVDARPICRGSFTLYRACGAVPGRDRSHPRRHRVSGWPA